eukprot:4244254-Pyramimonas_sp.AAC.1
MWRRCWRSTRHARGRFLNPNRIRITSGPRGGGAGGARGAHEGAGDEDQERRHLRGPAHQVPQAARRHAGRAQRWTLSP